VSEAEAIARGAAALRTAGIDDPVREARMLWRAAFPRRYVDYEAAMSGGMEREFDALISRRVAHEPMSHLLGYRDFYKHRFAIDARALDPRADTETLLEVALAQPFSHVLDLGTGSGCILLSLLAERPAATGTGTDLSEDALDVARQNRAALDLETRADLIRSDWFAQVEGRFDLIVSNPPYIAADEMAGLAPELSHEPRMALTDEGDGLSAYRAIIGQASEYLDAEGRLIVEIGHRQGGAVSDLMTQAGFADVQIHRDLEGRDRVVGGIRPA
jgi:release factor glutamine methyltransferase